MLETKEIPYKGWDIGENLSQERHLVGGKLTGWISTDSVRQVDCPKCYAEKGYHCITPKGRKAWPPHGQRSKKLLENTNLENYKVKV